MKNYETKARKASIGWGRCLTESFCQLVCKFWPFAEKIFSRRHHIFFLLLPFEIIPKKKDVIPSSNNPEKFTSSVSRDSSTSIHPTENSIPRFSESSEKFNISCFFNSSKKRRTSLSRINVSFWCFSLKKIFSFHFIAFNCLSSTCSFRLSSLRGAKSQFKNSKLEKPETFQ